MKIHVDHDRLTKELISKNFPDFMRLFAPQIARDIDWASLELLDKELNELIRLKKRSVDLVAKVKYKNVQVFLIIHIEMQSRNQKDFARRMFVYYARLHEKYGLPIYPIVLCTYDKPERPEPDCYRIDFPGRNVLYFGFQVVQLNALDWHKFQKSKNPIACALMAKMKMARGDSPKLKLECLRKLAKLELDDERARLISCYVDTYLKLDAREEREYTVALNRVEPQVKERVMELTTSWMEKGRKEGRNEGRKEGRKEGREQGKLEGMRETVSRQLHARVGYLDANLMQKIQALSLAATAELSEALLNFSTLDDLNAWINKKSKGS